MIVSETATRLPLDQARAIADELVVLLEPYCERLEVCGSIRRQAKTCGDIDIVAVARWQAVTDMFGQEIGKGVDLLAARLDELCGERVIQQARRSDGAIQGWGKRLRHAVFGGLKVQVQAVDPEVLGMWMVIRTGPSGYSHAFVTPRGQKAALRDRDGTVVEYRPGMLPPGFSIEDGEKGQSKFRVHKAHQFVPTPTEEDVYTALGWRYPSPEARK